MSYGRSVDDIYYELHREIEELRYEIESLKQDIQGMRENIIEIATSGNMGG